MKIDTELLLELFNVLIPLLFFMMVPKFSILFIPLLELNKGWLFGKLVVSTAEVSIRSVAVLSIDVVPLFLQTLSLKTIVMDCNIPPLI